MKDVITTDEAAELLNMDRKALLRGVKRGDIPGRRIGRIYRFSREALMAWLACKSAPEGIRHAG